MMRVQERIMPKKPRNDAIDQKLKEKFTRGAQHFEVACRQHGFHRVRSLQLDGTRFTPPRKPSPQGELF